MHMLLITYNFLFYKLSEHILLCWLVIQCLKLSWLYNLGMLSASSDRKIQLVMPQIEKKKSLIRSQESPSIQVLSLSFLRLHSSGRF